MSIHLVAEGFIFFGYSVFLILFGAALAAADTVEVVNLEGTLGEQRHDLPDAKNFFFGFTLDVDEGDLVAKKTHYRLVTTTFAVENKLHTLIGKRVRVRGLVGYRGFTHYFTVTDVKEVKE